MAMTPLFHLGHTVATPGALEALSQEGILPELLLVRHVTGDWGDVSEEDKKANNQDLVDGGRLLSAYALPNTGKRIWIITEADRSVTTFLLPEEY